MRLFASVTVSLMMTRAEISNSTMARRFLTTSVILSITHILFLVCATPLFAQSGKIADVAGQTQTAAAASAANVNGASDAPAEYEVFGDWLFTGEFADDSFAGFNPDY